MIAKLKYWIRNYFGFSQTETNGFLILVVLMAFLVVLPSLYATLFHNSPKLSKADQSKLNGLLNSIDDIPSNESYKPVQARANSDIVNKSLFYFNPNAISITEWQKLGLSKNMAERIEKYKAKGGKFRKPEDLLKIYGFPEDLYAELESYIQLPSNTKEKFKKKNEYAERTETGESENIERKKFTKKEITRFEINQADTTTLSQIKGIGQTLAQRIVDFREKLGGFHDISQIKEVYGIKPKVAEELLKYGFVEKALVRKVNINQASIDEMKIHPYIKHNLAKAIVNYRMQHGNFTKIEDLSKIKIINPEILQKLAPYLTL